jgi:aminoglycoside phosphotransferase family enzyme/predicted kinase
MAQDRSAQQDEVIAFLSQPETYGSREPVERIETHAALVFLAGDRAIKIKKAVALGYLDFSTLDKRRRALARELELNRSNAPEIYRDLTAIIRNPDGGLSLGAPSISGGGEPVEWALIMSRFDQDQLLDRIAARQPLDVDLATALADAVLAAHRNAAVAKDADQLAAMTRLVDQISHDLERLGAHIHQAAAFRPGAQQALERARACLASRAANGWVRRCHGDLHLGNIVVMGGRPMLFDALEFDEQMATVDVLYDLAFLLMDLLQRAQASAANRVLNRYLQGASGNEEGLAALPLFMGLRAGVRAMVIAERAAQAGGDRTGAADYLGTALKLFDPPPPRLVAIGGFSGTGKTTLAAALAPDIGAAPGAVHLRSDVERKALFDVAETTRLDPGHYDTETTARVYRRVEARAKAVLEAGHSVIADAVFARPEERQAIEDIARQAGAGFTGIWLSAPGERLAERVSARRGDASDATAAVVEMQIERGAGPVAWRTIDASVGLNQVASAARALLEL